MVGGGVIGNGVVGLPSFGRRDLIRLLESAGWSVTGTDGASVTLIDGRGDFERALAAVAALGSEAERSGAALLAVVSRADAKRLDALFEAGATHFSVDPTDKELIQAIRFTERHVERVARGDGRRRGDQARSAPAGYALHSWVAERITTASRVTVARVELASFDLVNSAHGRATGDLILGEATERLERVAAHLFGREAIVSRGSGPEFVLAGSGTEGEEDALAAELSRALAEPFGRAVVGARIGVAAARPGDDADALLRRAGEAFSPREDGVGVEELAIDLHHAIGTDGIAVLFQPQVDIADCRIMGVEALARWSHPELGPVGAEALFAAAECAGLAAALSEHVQRLALEEAARWPAPLDGLRLSVNVTAEDVGAPNFAERFLARVRAAGFPPERLTVEVTETGLIADLDRAGALLGRLREAGCRTAIDDFGSGYSSLAYLNALPLDYLKLDRTLVRGVERDGRERMVVRAVLALARSLELHVVAEGVETEAQRNLLAREGCEIYQGFLCAGALGRGELAELVTRL